MKNNENFCARTIFTELIFYLKFESEAYTEEFINRPLFTLFRASLRLKYITKSWRGVGLTRAYLTRANIVKYLGNMLDLAFRI